jgi:tetratricopeptide (TPR) repeat protein
MHTSGGSVESRYDVFVSYPWADRAAVEPLAQALRDYGLRVFVDDPEIDDFDRITTRITQSLAASKVLLAYYSKRYPTRRACQWELTAAYLAAQRAGDPSRRILVLNPEPGLDHLHPGELRDALALRPPTEGDAAALAALAQEVADRVQALAGPLGELAPLVPARWLPTQGLGSARFVGRLPEMWHIHSALHPDTTRLTVGRTGPAVAQVRGLGGIGKSLLAEEYALRFGAAYPGGIYWLRAYGSHEDDRPTTFEELIAEHDRQVRTIAARLGLQVADRSPDEVLGALGMAMSERGQPCLWVVDDLPDGLAAPQVQALLAPHPVACTLVTTRSRRYEDLATVVALDVLPPGDALALLISQRLARTDEDHVAAAELVADLGYHALAVDVAGAALRTQTGLGSFAEFRAALQETSHDELELAGELAKALPGGHQASIAATLSRSISRLGAEGSDVLRLAAMVASAPVPLALMAAVLQRADGLDERAARQQAIRGVAQAETLSLATPTGLSADPDAASEPTVEGGWVVHALVARTMRFTDPDQQRTAALRAAAVATLSQALQAIVDPSAHTSLRQVVPHARELARQPESTDEVELLGWVARYDLERGDFRPAERGFRQQWDARQRVLGPEHPATLRSLNDLAGALQAMGNLAGAWDLHQQVLDARRRVLGPDHPDTLTSINNLAGVLQEAGDLAGARDLHRQLLDAYRRLLGPEHPATLRSMNNLAGALYALGELAAARDLSEHVVDARRRVLGAEHPDTLRSMNNLAETLRALGDLAGARELLEQVVEAQRRLLGPEHPGTLTATKNLALTLHALGELAAARDLHEQVVDARRRVLGPEHPATLTAMGGLAETLRAQGELAGARDLHQEVLDAQHRVLGPEHPDTLNSISNLALTLQALGDVAGAQDLNEQVVEAYRRVLGPEHPATLTSMNNLAGVLQDAGDLAGARDLNQQVLEAYRRVLGPDHPLTLNAMNNLAGTLRALGERAAARELFEQVVDAHRRVLGPEHPATLNSMNNLAGILQDGGDVAGARDLNHQVVEAYRRVLGPEHPATLGAMNNLAGSLVRLGELAAAHDLLEEIVGAYRRVLGADHPTTRTVTENLAWVQRAIDNATPAE